jgi:hypothetical protein
MEEIDKIKQDIAAMQAIVRSLDEENKALMQTLIDVNAKVEAATADDMKTLTESLSQLDDLEDQADEEENQGAIQATQNQINSI